MERPQPAPLGQAPQRLLLAPGPSDMNLHPQLQHQLHRLGFGEGLAPSVPGAMAALLRCVSNSYAERDQQLELLQVSVNEHAEVLKLTDARLSSLLSLSADWIWEQDAEMRFTFVSDGIEAVTGIPAARLIGRKRDFNAGFESNSEAVATMQGCMAANLAFRDVTLAMNRPDGARRFVRVSGEPVFDLAGAFQGYRGVSRDVTQAALAERRVQELARFDALTKLPNRSMFLTELDRAIDKAQLTGQAHQGNDAPNPAFALCFIDLDRFKAVNDTLGHDAGDELLRTMARRLRGAVRNDDLVARLGGDEFVVLLEGSPGLADLRRVADKLLAAIGEPLDLQGLSFPITGSIGIALYPSDGHDAGALLKHADTAMYLAKERGKNNIQFYSAELAGLAAREFALESELRQALEHNELVLHYQPKFNVDNGRICGVEALVRWAHPTRGMVPPGEFIPLAEERGLIVPIGRWVMQTACWQIQAWRSAGVNPPSVAINLSARQFSGDSLVEDLSAAMATCGVLPRELEVELTESVLMAEPERASQVLQELAALGVKIAIDDFGTGYSSLSYLKRFPAQTVKIDRSFISGLPDDRDDVAITQAVIAMAHSLGLGVVAEGVETEEQLAMLCQLGCDEAQGYLLGRPMPAEQLTRRLELVQTAPGAMD